MSGESSALRVLLARRSPEIIRPGLTPIRRLLARLGDPHLGLRVVHVAGTNGKGSVIAFLEAMLMAAGIPVAVFTSPHLHRFNERIRVDRRPIDDAQLDAVLTETLAHDPDARTTFFELTTAAAFLYFSRCAVFDRHRGVLLLETGLGGRLDATNVVRPWLSVITALGLDHADFLGASLAGIAREKAGILKREVPAVVAPHHAEAARVLKGVAARLQVPLTLAGRDYGLLVPEKAETGRGWWRFRDRAGSCWLPTPSLPGRHQFDNAALAVAGARRLRELGLPVTARAMRIGVASAIWPGRLERMPGAPPVWLDGAHNPDAIRALVRFLADPGRGGGRLSTVLLFSVLNNKDGATMARLLAPWVSRVFTVSLGGERSRSADDLASLWPESGPEVVGCDSVTQALQRAREAASPGGRVIVTGSLYLVGEVRSLLC
ncbi:MAG: bifunctional folylpolyglutamate synthase/dihydrofolate synthase [Magnetococcales bacterium]|nr:bifunctional folylpolyglutamate synthase/dihydrofolate synthase [Magnetococcales bacterium]